MQALVVTPVKDAVEASLETIRAVKQSTGRFAYWVFNDFSSDDTKSALQAASQEMDFKLIHLEELTDHPSPNYDKVLWMSQKEALEAKVPLIIIESDVTVQPDTIERLLSFAHNTPNAGLVGAITHDEQGRVNFPYLKFKNEKRKGAIETNRSLSFCCTLLSIEFLKQYDFADLDLEKDWYDTHISHKALDVGFENYILMDLPVGHRPHGSRPWKHLKYSNPLYYYFKKWFSGKDKI
ncbi:glycosyltransferase [Cyclobacterium salsum]|uniref:glycosyltransferase n=1 Tax=Cyclobacterium salsum TaxID=2666329 RepID=UPI0013920F7B|nr:glycosyltransferase [Cyclobacterium salsum]